MLRPTLRFVAVGGVTVEEVRDRRGWRRFHDLAQHLHRGAPGWVPPLLTRERAEMAALDDGLAFLARARGRPAGRVVAWRDRADGATGAGGAAGRFGWFEAIDDAGVAGALLDAAGAWLSDQGCDVMEGPAGLLDAGVRVGGFDGPVAVGLPWHPPRYAALLEQAGCTPVADHPWFALPVPLASHLTESALSAALSEGDGGWARDHGLGWLPAGDTDPRLVVWDAAGGAVALPDVVGGLAHVGLRSAWGAARQARERRWARAVIVRLEGEAALLVPPLCEAAARAGYEEILSPWAPPAVAPVITFRTYRRRTGGGSRQ